MSSNTEFFQKPRYSTLAVGQEIIFSVSNAVVVLNETRVKYIVRVFIQDEEAGLSSLGTNTNVIGTFKVSPNNAGVGMIDISNVVENYVNSDNLATNGSAVKQKNTDDDYPNPIHFIDRYSKNKNTIKYLALRFTLEYLDETTNLVTEDTGTWLNTDVYRIFNGYIKRTDPLVRGGVTSSGFTLPFSYFGFDLSKFNPATAAQGGPGIFLTNAPRVQYANDGDYGTLSFLTINTTTSKAIRKIIIKTFNSAGVQQSLDTIGRTSSAGSYTYNDFTPVSDRLVGYFGCFPGNLRNWSSNFKSVIEDPTKEISYYTIETQNNSDVKTIETYTIYINCPNTKGYESIRLCWLNQWGAWDYYTFTQKSVRKTTTKGSTYNQLAGTWSETTYKPYGFKGGKKSFRVNATETISMNTDFVSEDENVMFEELTNSPEVYILQPYRDNTDIYSMLNDYVTPVRLKSTSFTKKTIANDKLLQYTFEIEKSQILRTQSI